MKEPYQAPRARAVSFLTKDQVQTASVKCEEGRDYSGVVSFDPDPFNPFKPHDPRPPRPEPTPRPRPTRRPR